MNPTFESASPPRIGVFDSGLGGLSVLRAIHALMPSAQLVYVADSGHAPYGERSTEHVRTRSLAIAAYLRNRGVDVLVIACNTATAEASRLLRERYPDWPIVGVEPGIKPAAALSRTGRIGVMATEVTLRSDKFQLLAAAHAAHVHLILQPCPGLAAAIEEGDLESPTLQARVADCCAPLRGQGVDTVVLGCTHYPFVAHLIHAQLGPEVQLIDTAEAVARRTLAVCPTRPLLTATRTAKAIPELLTTGSLATLQKVSQHWLPFPCRVGSLPH